MHSAEKYSYVDIPTFIYFIRFYFLECKAAFKGVQVTFDSNRLEHLVHFAATKELLSDNFSLGRNFPPDQYVQNKHCFIFLLPHQKYKGPDNKKPSKRLYKITQTSFCHRLLTHFASTISFCQNVLASKLIHPRLFLFSLATPL